MNNPKQTSRRDFLQASAATTAALAASETRRAKLLKEAFGKNGK